MSQRRAASAASHPVRVCFVCLGNICRSPTAEGVLRHLLAEAGLEANIQVDSAGTAAYHTGEPPDRRSALHAARRGIRLGGAARQFEASDFERFDYVLAMDASNYRELSRLARSKEARAKLHYCRDFDASAEPGSSVPDPYYGGEAGFEEVLDQCEAACRGLITHIQQTWR